MKTMKCDLCDHEASGENFDEWMNALKPHYAEMHKDFMEEMYEFPLILGLFMMTLHIMKQDKPPVVAEPVYLELDDHEAVAKN